MNCWLKHRETSLLKQLLSDWDNSQLPFTTPRCKGNMVKWLTPRWSQRDVGRRRERRRKNIYDWNAASHTNVTRNFYCTLSLSLFEGPYAISVLLWEGLFLLDRQIVETPHDEDEKSEEILPSLSPSPPDFTLVQLMPLSFSFLMHWAILFYVSLSLSLFLCICQNEKKVNTLLHRRARKKSCIGRCDLNFVTRVDKQCTTGRLFNLKKKKATKETNESTPTSSSALSTPLLSLSPSFFLSLSLSLLCVSISLCFMLLVLLLLLLPLLLILEHFFLSPSLSKS